MNEHITPEVSLTEIITASAFCDMVVAGVQRGIMITVDGDCLRFTTACTDVAAVGDIEDAFGSLAAVALDVDPISCTENYVGLIHWDGATAYAHIAIMFEHSGLVIED